MRIRPSQVRRLGFLFLQPAEFISSLALPDALAETIEGIVYEIQNLQFNPAAPIYFFHRSFLF